MSALVLILRGVLCVKCSISHRRPPGRVYACTSRMSNSDPDVVGRVVGIA